MEIPQDVRSKFAGKRRFTKSLQTDKLATAEQRKWTYISKWKSVVAAARKGDDHLSKMRRFLETNASEFPRTIERPDGSTFVETAEDFLLGGYVADVAPSNNDDETGDPAVYDAFKVFTGEWVKLSEHIEAWKERKARIDQVAPKTLDQMAADVEQFCKKFTYLHDVTSEAVADWVLSDQKSMATNNRRATSYRSLLSFLGDKNPLPKLFVNADIPKNQRVRPRNERRQPFTDAEVVKIYNACTDPSLRDLVALDAYTGCRIEELCDLLVEDVNRENSSIYIKSGKTDAAIRHIPLHPNLQQMIERLCQQSKDGYVLSGLSGKNKYNKRS
ncbi:MAG: tyrosine-type recombinase/integrase, partial [Rhizobiaceae bacterium]